MSRWDWSQLSDRIVLESLPGSTSLAVRHDGEVACVDLPQSAAAELVDELVAIYGHKLDDQRVELEEALTAAEGERDEALERVKTLEAQLAEALTTIEQHRTALDLADTRARQLEAIVEAWDRPGDARRAEHRIAKSTAARVVREALS